jgi:hypothetical protein
MYRHHFTDNSSKLCSLSSVMFSPRHAVPTITIDAETVMNRVENLLLQCLSAGVAGEIDAEEACVCDGHRHVGVGATQMKQERKTDRNNSGSKAG